MENISRVTFLEKIQKYPELQQRFEQLLLLVKTVAGDVQKASEAELHTL